MTVAGRLLADHLWQSTAFAALAWLLTRLLRSNRAAIRHGVWVAASVKFLVPFAALARIGSYLFARSAVASGAQPALGAFVDVISQPFSQPPARVAAALTASPGTTMAIVPLVLLACWVAGSLWRLIAFLVQWREVKKAVREADTILDGPEVAALRRATCEARVSTPITLVASDSSFEPGVFGITKPILLWPRLLSDHLADSQVDSILAHEVSHVRRRDNLYAAIHIAVEIVFWFHPLVWWLGGRLVDERERACDEDVIALGHAREAYAESLLETCRLSVEVPLAYVSGVTGADLGKRLERIMRSHAIDALSSWRKVLLAAASLMAVAVPVTYGVVHAPRVLAQTEAQPADPVRVRREMRMQIENLRQHAEVVRQLGAAGLPATAGQPRQAFDVTSVKRNNAGEGRISMMRTPDGAWEATNVTLGLLVRMSYQVQDSQIVGGPDWLFSDRFDVRGESRALASSGPAMEKVQSLLADRFNLGVHTETREMPMYALALSRRDGKAGLQLRPSSFECPDPSRTGVADGPPPPPPPPPPAPGGPAVGLGALANVERPRCGMRISPGGMLAGGLTMAQFARSLSQIVGRIVVDKTGLAGTYDWELSYAPDRRMAGRSDFPPVPSGATMPAIEGPSIFTALQEQLGLKLDSQQGPVDVLVVDRAEQPMEDR
jgi:uncharacterized protein (TIGR03435 family)